MWQAFFGLLLIGGWCFTILCWSLPYMNMNQPQVYTCPLSEPSSHLPLHPILLGCHRAPDELLHRTPNSHGLLRHMVMYMFPCCSLNSSLSFPHHVHILFSVCVSTAGLQIGSSVPSTVLSHWGSASHWGAQILIASLV